MGTSVHFRGAAVTERPNVKYFTVPMARVLDNAVAP